MKRLDNMLHYGHKRAIDIQKTLVKNNLWRRMLKNVIATTITVALCLLDVPNGPFGKAAYLAPMFAVFVHPGRRFGQLVETLSLALAGAFVGLAWTALGIYLGSLVVRNNETVAYAIRAVFLTISLLIHGYLRAHTPRLFIFVLVLIIICATGFTSTAMYVSASFINQLLYPILMAAAVILLVNISIFPEFSSGFLGKTTIEALVACAKSLSDAGHYFVEPIDGATTAEGIVKKSTTTSHHSKKTKDSSTEPATFVSVASITSTKSNLRKQLSKCTEAQRESQFEVAYSILPPRYMRPISKYAMEKFVANTIAVIGACESRFALLGDPSETPGADEAAEEAAVGHNEHIDPTGITLELVKPQREIEFGDVHLLRYLLARVHGPYMDLQAAVTQAVTVICVCLAVAYDVSKLPSGHRAPKGITLEEIDIHEATIEAALHKFDADTTAALEQAVVLQELQSLELDIMPREEIFLVSSFLLNYRQAVTQLKEMLQYSRTLVEKRDAHHGWRRLYLPQIQWKKWLYSGGEDDESTPASGRQANRTRDAQDSNITDDADNFEFIPLVRQNRDLENSGDPRRLKRRTVVPVSTQNKAKDEIKNDGKPRVSRTLRFRGHLADTVEWLQESEDVLYALKLAAAGILVTWPAFVPSLNSFYSINRCSWVVLQLIFVFEVAIGATFMSFFVRSIGTTLGCLWGWAAFEARHGDPVVCVALIFVGMIPAVYIQLGSQYPKAGIVATISMSVVALSTALKTVPGDATENFLKRWIAFLIGGLVALIVEVVILPVKARTRLVESLATAIKRIGEMEACIGYGIEDGTNLEDGFPKKVVVRFENATGKAKTALAAAELFLPSCSTEPRLKGSFASLALIYGEIIFVLHQIIDRMDNLLQLRTVYGSGPLEEFNSEIYPYRRNVAGAVTLVLYAVHEALTTKLPLPQFLPSARLAHLRLINKVREIVEASVREENDQEDLNKLVRKRAVRRKYMSWNASSAAQVEVIEYMEELTDLTKLLVGANEFRSGMLTRPTYREYAGGAGMTDDEGVIKQDPESLHQVLSSPSVKVSSREQATATKTNSNEFVPVSLKRIQTRKVEAGTRRRQTVGARS